MASDRECARMNNPGHRALRIVADHILVDRRVGCAAVVGAADCDGCISCDVAVEAALAPVLQRAIANAKMMWNCPWKM